MRAGGLRESNYLVWLPTTLGNVCSSLFSATAFFDRDLKRCRVWAVQLDSGLGMRTEMGKFVLCSSLVIRHTVIRDIQQFFW